MKKTVYWVLMTAGVVGFAVLIFGTCQPFQDWVARYDGPTHFIDQSYSLAVDPSGNVYVTGVSWGFHTDSDIVTIKYDNAGNTVWETIYDGPAHASEYGPNLAVDADGNVYLAATTNYDVVTVKYDTSGNQVWARIYGDDLLENQEERAYDMTIDASGNVYVVGKTEAYTQSDYLTLKYDGAGILKWAAKYDGPVHRRDDARDIAVDSEGNVYVTGGSAMRMLDCRDIDGTTLCPDTDWVTIKYDRNGNKVWVSAFNGPIGGVDYGMGIAVDSSGHVYVTGSGQIRLGSPDPDYPDDDRDIFTIKYDSATGNQTWVAQFSGPISSLDRPMDIATDSESNIYVTGLCTKEMREAADDPVYGMFRWDSDYLTLKYHDNGPGYTEEWAATYDGSGNNYDEAVDLAVDRSGKVYVTGRSYGGATGMDCVTVCYTGSGEEMWTRSYGGPGNDYDVGYEVAVDSDKNIYVGCYGAGDGTNDDFVTIKYGQYRTVPIDVKPRTASNVINLKSRGRVPVAIISTEDFDAATIDPLTVTFAGARVARKEKTRKPMAALHDVNGDGLPDLVVHFKTAKLHLRVGEREAVLKAETFDLTCITGSDRVRVIK